MGMSVHQFISVSPKKYGEWQIFCTNIHLFSSKAKQLFLLFAYSLSFVVVFFRDLHKKVLGVLSACLCLAVKHFVSSTDIYFFA